jgi:hypothetical protein
MKFSLVAASPANLKLSVVTVNVSVDVVAGAGFDTRDLSGYESGKANL